MAINYPTSLDSLTNPLSTDLLTSPAHSTQHSNVNDAVEALEAKVGADASAVTTSHDYKLGEVTGTDKAVGKTATQTLTNKTLTAPQINMGSDATGDTYYRTAGGAFARLPIGTTSQILNVDAAGIPAWVANPAAADASPTVKGVSELNTQAEHDAGTSTGGTGAKLVVTPDTVRARLLNTGVLDTGSANTVVIAPSPAITAYAAYQEFTFKAAATNTGATTINVNALGTKNIYKNGTSALSGGEIVTGGIYTVTYDGTQFQLKNNSIVAVDQDSAPNVLTTFGTYATSVMKIDADLGWTVSGGATLSTLANGTSVSIAAGSTNCTVYNSLLGRSNHPTNTLVFNSGIDMKLSYWMINSAISAGSSPAGAGDQWYWHGFCNPSSSIDTFANITNTTSSRVGFSHYNGRIYAITCSGSATTTTDIMADTASTKRFYMIDFNQTSCKFYINGALVATHTTNIPNNTDGCAVEFGSYNGDSGAHSIGVSNPVLSETLS